MVISSKLVLAAAALLGLGGGAYSLSSPKVEYVELQGVQETREAKMKNEYMLGSLSINDPEENSAYINRWYTYEYKKSIENELYNIPKGYLGLISIETAQTIGGNHIACQNGKVVGLFKGELATDFPSAGKPCVIRKT